MVVIRKPVSKKQAVEIGREWLEHLASHAPLEHVDEICLIIMLGFAKPKTRFDTPDASIFVNTFLFREGRAKLPFHDNHVDKALLFMWNEGWIGPSIHRRELLAHYRFTPAGISHWEDSERAAFFTDLAKERPIWQEKLEAAEREKREEKEAAENVVKERANLKRFGVPWNVHEKLREEGFREWDD